MLRQNFLVLCPAPLLSQPLLVSWSPPFREAAAAVGGLGEATAPSRLWLREELEFEKIVCVLSALWLQRCVVSFTISWISW